MRVVLGSGSPRRRELLARAGVVVAVWPADLDESPLPDEDPVAYVRRLAVDKAHAVVAAVRDPDAVVLAADTTVDLDGRILAKPADADEARAMLRSLSARDHLVHTGVAVCRAGATAAEVATTAVRFRPLGDDAIERYVGTGEPLDRAGAYAIQGGARDFVTHVGGSYTNVVGLPMELVRDLLGRHGIDVTVVD